CPGLVRQHPRRIRTRQKMNTTFKRISAPRLRCQGVESVLAQYQRKKITLIASSVLLGPLLLPNAAHSFEYEPSEEETPFEGIAYTPSEKETPFQGIAYEPSEEKLQLSGHELSTKVRELEQRHEIIAFEDEAKAESKVEPNVEAKVEPKAEPKAGSKAEPKA